MIPYLKWSPGKMSASPLTSNKRPVPKYALFSCLQITLLARKIFQLFLVGIALAYLSDMRNWTKRFCFFNLTVFVQFFFLSILQGRLLFFSRWKTSVVTSQVACLTSRENHIEPDAIQTKLSFPTRYSLQTLVNKHVDKWNVLLSCYTNLLHGKAGQNRNIYLK